MAPIDLLAQPDSTDQLNKDETASVEGGGRDRWSRSKMVRCRLKELAWSRWRRAVRPVSSREGSEAVHYSIKTRADVTPSHYFHDRWDDLYFVIFAQACLSGFVLISPSGRLSLMQALDDNTSYQMQEHNVYQLQELIQKHRDKMIIIPREWQGSCCWIYK